MLMDVPLPNSHTVVAGVVDITATGSLATGAFPDIAAQIAGFVLTDATKGFAHYRWIPGRGVWDDILSTLTVPLTADSIPFITRHLRPMVLLRVLLILPRQRLDVGWFRASLRTHPSNAVVLLQRLLSPTSPTSPPPPLASDAEPQPPPSVGSDTELQQDHSSSNPIASHHHPHGMVPDVVVDHQHQRVRLLLERLGVSVQWTPLLFTGSELTTDAWIRAEGFVMPEVLDATLVTWLGDDTNGILLVRPAETPSFETYAGIRGFAKQMEKHCLLLVDRPLGLSSILIRWRDGASRRVHFDIAGDDILQSVRLMSGEPNEFRPQHPIVMETIDAVYKE